MNTLKNFNHVIDINSRHFVHAAHIVSFEAVADHYTPSGGKSPALVIHLSTGRDVFENFESFAEADTAALLLSQKLEIYWSEISGTPMPSCLASTFINKYRQNNNPPKP